MVSEIAIAIGCSLIGLFLILKRFSFLGARAGSLMMKLSDTNYGIVSQDDYIIIWIIFGHTICIILNILIWQAF